MEVLTVSHLNLHVLASNRQDNYLLYSRSTPVLAAMMQEAQQQTYIEFGAGKGYLSSMLADASEAQQFVLLDMRSFRMKADR